MRPFMMACLLAVLCSCSKSIPEQVEEKVKYMGAATAELGTVEYSISKIIKADHDVFYKFGDRKILFSSHSTMKAGVDLSKFCADSVVVDKKNKAITIKLPKEKVLSFHMPAENIKMEWSRTGMFRSDFTAQERNELLKQGEEDIMNDAENLGILKDAEANARMMFEAMLAGAGYKKIDVVFAKN
ncbi:MAG: DUF4230 domain-containing protein [Bacteroidales bacterium]|nr:DUF4230 domain-containing protein [Bacteroidales bacterium]